MASGRDVDKAWVDNYPPLRDFLCEVEARCDWQLSLGEDGYAGYVEQWRTPNGRTMIVTVRSCQNGWDIATPADTNSIAETLLDVRARLGLGEL